jgi:hypothetical protein
VENAKRIIRGVVSQLPLLGAAAPAAAPGAGERHHDRSHSFRTLRRRYGLLIGKHLPVSNPTGMTPAEARPRLTAGAPDQNPVPAGPRHRHLKSVWNSLQLIQDIVIQRLSEALIYQLLPLSATIIP